MMLRPKKRAVLAAVTLAVAAGAGPAAWGSPVQIPVESAGEPHLALLSFTPEHRPAAEAVLRIRPLLSSRGSARLLPGGKTLQVQDHSASLERIVRALRAFDQPAQPLRLEVLVVQASTVPVSPQPPQPKEIPATLLARWRSLLRYEHYYLVGRVELAPREGEAVHHSLGAGYEVSFRLGDMVENGQVKLEDFRLTRTVGKRLQELIHTNLNPRLDQTMSLGLAQDEASRTALMVVIICREPGRWGDLSPAAPTAQRNTVGGS
jgi:hypothetical protein